MFLAHLPAGYLLSQRISNRFGFGTLIWIGLIGSVLPDFDLFYFYLIDGRQHPHHSYWSHIPAFWLIIFCVTILISVFGRHRRLTDISLILFPNIFLHLLLDSVAGGGIKWFYPITEINLALFTVPSTFSWWVLNFVFHWTFIFEIAIISWAAFKIFGVRKQSIEQMRFNYNMRQILWHDS